MDFISKQTFLFCQTDFYLGKQLIPENWAKNRGLNDNSYLGTIQVHGTDRLSPLWPRGFQLPGAAAATVQSLFPGCIRGRGRGKLKERFVFLKFRG